MENLYNCRNCLTTFHPKCLKQHIDMHKGNNTNCPNCNIEIEFSEITNIRKLHAEDEKADEKAEVYAKRPSKKCIIM